MKGTQCKVLDDESDPTAQVLAVGSLMTSTKVSIRRKTIIDRVLQLESPDQHEIDASKIEASCKGSWNFADVQLIDIEAGKLVAINRPSSSRFFMVGQATPSMRLVVDVNNASNFDQSLKFSGCVRLRFVKQKPTASTLSLPVDSTLQRDLIKAMNDPAQVRVDAVSLHHTHVIA